MGAKTPKIEGRNYSNFTITFPTICRCAGDFLKVLLKFEMAAMDELHNFLWSQKLKNVVRNNLNFTITLPTIWKCAGDFTEI